MPDIKIQSTVPWERVATVSAVGRPFLYKRDGTRRGATSIPPSGIPLDIPPFEGCFLGSAEISPGRGQGTGNYFVGNNKKKYTPMKSLLTKVKLPTAYIAEFHLKCKFTVEL